ncbi:MAG: GNAT family N-acetyltransferase [Planctomycetota bacterium]|nr:GNAT family N-acetyltransferase [Planctomycetota bacterium]
MTPAIRQIEDLEEALALAPLLDRCAEDALREFRDDPLPPDVSRRFLERGFDARETVVLVAEANQERTGGDPVGLCVVGPFADPLTSEVVPMIVLLHVRQEARHRGLARKLVDAARRVLAERGIKCLAARAGHNDDALISMGERWGFLRTWELMLLE